MKKGIDYFPADRDWNFEKAEAHAKSMGLDTYRKDGKLFIERRYVAAKFQIEDGPVYSGYRQLMTSWNGWELPFFERSEANRIIEGEKSNAEEQELEWSEKGTYIIDRTYPTDKHEPPAKIEQQIIRVDKKDVVVFDLSLGWIWSLA